MILDRLNNVNNILIRSVHDEAFETYGRIVGGYDFSSLAAYVEANTGIPEQGNIYVPTVAEMEALSVTSQISSGLYGGSAVQIGYCNGRNTTYNGFEYHKGSEINIGVTGFMLVLGHSWDIKDNTYRVEEAEVFFLEKGTAVELFQTTLHLSPCRINEEGFKDVVILPRGTNIPFEDKPETVEAEGSLLLLKNKWVLAHPECKSLISQGAHPGLVGPNKELQY